MAYEHNLLPNPHGLPRFLSEMDERTGKSPYSYETCCLQAMVYVESLDCSTMVSFAERFHVIIGLCCQMCGDWDTMWEDIPECCVFAFETMHRSLQPNVITNYFALATLVRCLDKQAVADMLFWLGFDLEDFNFNSDLKLNLLGETL